MVIYREAVEFQGNDRVTRATSDLVRVTFEDGTTLTGTRNHPVWAPTKEEWRGLGEFSPGQSVQSRHGFLAVSSVESLSAITPVYNIEVAGEHVYELTVLGVLVHNATGFDCERYLELLRKQRAGTLIDADEIAEFNRLKTIAPSSGRWIGSKVSAEATEAAYERMLARMKGLKAGGFNAVDDVGAFGSRSGSTFRGQGPLDSSDLDIAIKDFKGLKNSRHYNSVKAKLKSIADDFFNETGIRVELHLESAYNRLDWIEKIGF